MTNAGAATVGIRFVIASEVICPTQSSVRDLFIEVGPIDSEHMKMQRGSHIPDGEEATKPAHPDFAETAA